LGFNQLLEGVKGLLQKFVILTGAAKLGGSLTEDAQSLLRVHPLQRGQTSVLGKNFVERLVGGPSVGLGLGGVDQLAGHLRTGGVEEHAVGHGGAVLVGDVAGRELGRGLGAGRGPDRHGLDVDDGLHRRLVVGGLGVDVVDGAADIHLDGAVGRRRRDGGDGAELPSGGGSARRCSGRNVAS